MRYLIKSKLKIILSLVVILIISLGFLGYYFYQPWDKLKEPDRSPCLGPTEEVQYKAYEKKDGPSSAKIFVKDRNTNKVIFEFQIENIVPNHYYPYEAHRCGIYLVREFNFDYKKGKPLPDFRMEVWRYRYDGSGEKLIEENDFRVSSDEKYLFLIRGYGGSPDYAIVVKDIKTLNDIFVFPIEEIERRNPDMVASISFIRESWTRDGRYFWAKTHYGANVLGFIRIDSQNWNVDLLPTPPDVLGGDALNPENGYITVHPGNIWIGIYEIEEQEKAERREKGIGTELYIHNLFTGKRHFIAKTDEPLWFFKPKWLSDTELGYELPTGEKKIYKINEK